MSTKASISCRAEADFLFRQGDLVRFDEPENMAYIVMVTHPVRAGDAQFRGVTITANSFNSIGEFGGNYVTEQFKKFYGTIELYSE